MTEDNNTTEETNLEPTPDAEGKFDAEYVKGLRSEAAEARTKRKEAETALESEQTRTKTLRSRVLSHEVRTATAGVLADADDLLLHVAEADLLDDDGDPDPAKIAEAAKALAERKPHLRPRTPTGDVDQGARGGAATTFDFSDVLRKAAG